MSGDLWAALADLWVGSGDSSGDLWVESGDGCLDVMRSLCCVPAFRGGSCMTDDGLGCDSLCVPLIEAYCIT